MCRANQGPRLLTLILYGDLPPNIIQSIAHDAAELVSTIFRLNKFVCLHSLKVSASLKLRLFRQRRYFIRCITVGCKKVLIPGKQFSVEQFSLRSMDSCIFSNLSLLRFTVKKSIGSIVWPRGYFIQQIHQFYVFSKIQNSYFQQKYDFWNFSPFVIKTT